MPRNPDFTIEDFIARSTAGDSSLEEYRYELGLVQRWLGKPLVQATKRDLIDLKANKIRKLKSGAHYLVLMRMFYRAAGRKDLLEDKGLLSMKQRTERLRPDEILTPKEVEAMVRAADTNRDKALIGLLWDCGVRIHEALALRLRDIRVKTEDGRTLYVVWFGKVKVSGQEHVGYVMDTASFMRTWLDTHPEKAADSPLFVTYTGQPLGRKRAHEIVRGAAKRAGVEKRVYPHLFRHSRATYLLRQGLREIDVQRLLGWAPGSQMLRRYAHLATADTERAYLKAQGIAVPEKIDLERLTFTEDELRPVVPLNAPRPPIVAAHVKGLLDRPDVQEFLRLIGYVPAESTQEAKKEAARSGNGAPAADS